MIPKVGDEVTTTRVIQESDITGFAGITGDFNPVHLDDDFARDSRFNRRIAHGMLIASYISAVIGTQLPGPGTIYLRQELNFRAPVFIGDNIIVRVLVTNVREDKPLVTLKTTCVNQEEKTVLDGEALVLVDKIQHQ